MLLPISFNDPLSAAPIDPSLQSVEFVNGRLVFLYQLLMGGSGLIQYAVELRHVPLGVGDSTLSLCGFLESSQHETLAFAQIVGKKVGVIHNAHCFNDSCKE